MSTEHPDFLGFLLFWPVADLIMRYPSRSGLYDKAMMRTCRKNSKTDKRRTCVRVRALSKTDVLDLSLIISVYC